LEELVPYFLQNLPASKVEDFMRALKGVLQAYGYELLVSNSRRTRPDITALLHAELDKQPNCPLFMDVHTAKDPMSFYGLISKYPRIQWYDDIFRSHYAVDHKNGGRRRDIY